MVLDAGFLRACPIQPHFIWDHLWPSDVVDALETGVEECLDFL